MPQKSSGTLGPTSRAQKGVYHQLLFATTAIIVLIIIFAIIIFYIKHTYAQDEYTAIQAVTVMIIGICLAGVLFPLYSPITTWIYFTTKCELPEVIDAGFFLTIAKISTEDQLNYIFKHNIKIFITSEPLKLAQVQEVTAKYYSFFRIIYKYVPKCLHSFYFKNLLAAMWARKVCFIASEIKDLPGAKNILNNGKVKDHFDALVALDDLTGKKDELEKEVDGLKGEKKLLRKEKTEVAKATTQNLIVGCVAIPLIEKMNALAKDYDNKYFADEIEKILRHALSCSKVAEPFLKKAILTQKDSERELTNWRIPQNITDALKDLLNDKGLMAKVGEARHPSRKELNLSDFVI